MKAYFAINERLPAFKNSLFGRGTVVLSEAGRARFAEFPPLIADDLFLDSLFNEAEKAQAVAVEVVVGAPQGTRDLLRRLVRVRRGNSEMRSAAVAGEVRAKVRPSDKWAWLHDVVLLEPRLAPAAIPYVVITLLAGVFARRPGPTGWGRDDSTRGSKVDHTGRRG